MPAAFELKKAKNGKYYFNLLAANGEIVLTSQMYASKVTAKKGIASVKNNAAEKDQFATMKNKSGKNYFVLKAKNHQVIGTSQGYSSAQAVNGGIKSVGKNAPKAEIRDVSIKKIPSK